MTPRILEIGGPSPIFRRGGRIPVYPNAPALDNATFSRDTVWASGDETYSPEGKPLGKWYAAEMTALTFAEDASYDRILSAHALEHCANPLKALREWFRVLKPGGDLVLVLPNPQHTFDHRRPITTLGHLRDDLYSNVGEDDLTHFGEIMHLHDLKMDPGAPQDVAGFARRSLENQKNRCLHQHVFDGDLAIAALNDAGFQVERSSANEPDMVFRAYRPLERIVSPLQDTPALPKSGTAVFSTWSSGHALQEYVKFYLTQLLPHFERVDVVTNERRIVPEDIAWLKERGIRIMFVPNGGRDFGMWWRWMMREGRERIEDMARLALVNDSCICVGSLDKFFRWAVYSGLDVYGPAGCMHDEETFHHIQSYFVMFSHRVLPLIFDHFEATGMPSGHDAVNKYEVVLANIARRKGFRTGAMWQTTSHKDMSWQTIFYNVLKVAGIPIIKRTLLWRHHQQPERPEYPCGCYSWRDFVLEHADPEVAKWLAAPWPMDPKHTFRGRESEPVRKLNEPPPPAPKTLLIGGKPYRMATGAK